MPGPGVGVGARRVVGRVDPGLEGPFDQRARAVGVDPAADLVGVDERQAVHDITSFSLMPSRRAMAAVSLRTTEPETATAVKEMTARITR